jgi:hypothetical protein
MKLRIVRNRTADGITISIFDENNNKMTRSEMTRILTKCDGNILTDHTTGLFVDNDQRDKTPFEVDFESLQIDWNKTEMKNAIGILKKRADLVIAERDCRTGEVGILEM